MSPNGRLPKTLPEPIKRARDEDLRGFAGEGNVVERSERYASEAKPEEPKDSKRRAWAGLLCDEWAILINRSALAIRSSCIAILARLSWPYFLSARSLRASLYELQRLLRWPASLREPILRPCRSPRPLSIAMQEDRNTELPFHSRIFSSTLIPL
jgi:hypothetical protein